MSSESVEWDADVYHRVSNPQVEWGRRVLDRLPLIGTETVMDAGCGTGRLTRLLLERVPEGHVIAVDQSTGMVEAARDYLLPEYDGRITFLTTDLLDLTEESVADAIFSNATFHWILDHDALFGALLRALKPNGRLVAQCGAESNLARLLERAGKLADTDDFRTFFDGWDGPWHFAGPDLATSRMREAGFVDVKTSTEYAPTVLDGRREYSEFVRTVVLRLHLERLPDEQMQERFLGTLSGKLPATFRHSCWTTSVSISKAENQGSRRWM